MYPTAMIKSRHMEGMPEMPQEGQQRGLEGGIKIRLKLVRLRRAIEAIITPTVTGKGERLSQSEELLDIEPQRTADGILRYLVTSGLAVELTTGYERHHHDLDLVIMDPTNTDK